MSPDHSCGSWTPLFLQTPPAGASTTTTTASSAINKPIMKYSGSLNPAAPRFQPYKQPVHRHKTLILNNTNNTYNPPPKQQYQQQHYATQNNG